VLADLEADVAVRALDDHVGAGLRDRAPGGRVPLAADQPLGRVHGVDRVGDDLALGEVADQPLAALRDGDHRRRGPVAALVGDDLRDALLDDRHAGVGGAQVDADDVLHGADPRYNVTASEARLRRMLAAATRRTSQRAVRGGTGPRALVTRETASARR
jgi:NAD-specific glutamate dehydrogenase